MSTQVYQFDSIVLQIIRLVQIRFPRQSISLDRPFTLFLNYIKLTVGLGLCLKTPKINRFFFTTLRMQTLMIVTRRLVTNNKMYSFLNKQTNKHSCLFG